jgi:quercetin dioxygenase-like cupin family protein
LLRLTLPREPKPSARLYRWVTGACHHFRTGNKETDMIRRLFCAAAVAVCVIAASTHGAAADEKAKITLVYDQALPNVPGKSIRCVLVEYAPGGRSPAHLHPKSAFVYATVLEGSIRSQVNDGPVKTYRAGESFAEFPGDRHKVSENASDTQPARLLAVFIVDTKDTILTMPYHE